MTVSNVFYYLQQARRLHPVLVNKDIVSVIHAFVSSCLDYSKATYKLAGHKTFRTQKIPSISECCSASPKQQRLPWTHYTSPPLSRLASHRISNKVQSLSPYLPHATLPGPRIPKRPPKTLEQRPCSATSLLWHNGILNNERVKSMQEIKKNFLWGWLETVEWSPPG